MLPNGNNYINNNMMYIVNYKHVELATSLQQITLNNNSNNNNDCCCSSSKQLTLSALWEVSFVEFIVWFSFFLYFICSTWYLIFVFEIYLFMFLNELLWLIIVYGHVLRNKTSYKKLVLKMTLTGFGKIFPNIVIYQ